MRIILIIAMLCISQQTARAQEITAKEIVKKANDKMEGLSNESNMTMTIVRPTWQRSISLKSWAKGKELSLVLITDPAKDKGQTFLKIKNEMWNWVPGIQRMIKLLPSMMSQGWMESDYTNDDILKESSIVEDYVHTLTGTEKYSGTECYIIRLVPKPEAVVVWGSIIKWISKGSYFQLRSDYYDEDNKLVKTETSTQVKMMDDREIPTYIEIIPADKPGQKTTVTINKILFNKPVQDHFFSQQNMKTIR